MSSEKDFTAASLATLEKSSGSPLAPGAFGRRPRPQQAWQSAQSAHESPRQTTAQEMQRTRLPGIRIALLGPLHLKAMGPQQLLHTLGPEAALHHNADPPAVLEPLSDSPEHMGELFSCRPQSLVAAAVKVMALLHLQGVDRATLAHELQKRRRLPEAGGGPHHRSVRNGNRLKAVLNARSPRLHHLFAALRLHHQTRRTPQKIREAGQRQQRPEVLLAAREPQSVAQLAQDLPASRRPIGHGVHHLRENRAGSLQRAVAQDHFIGRKEGDSLEHIAAALALRIKLPEALDLHIEELHANGAQCGPLARHRAGHPEAESSPSSTRPTER